MAKTRMTPSISGAPLHCNDLTDSPCLAFPSETPAVAWALPAAVPGHPMPFPCGPARRARPPSLVKYTKHLGISPQRKHDKPSCLPHFNSTSVHRPCHIPLNYVVQSIMAREVQKSIINAPHSQLPRATVSIGTRSVTSDRQPDT